MLSKIRHDEKVRPALDKVFGNVLICRNLDVAVKFAGSTNLDCVTMDGDCVSNRGAISGGYQDSGRSRMVNMRMLREAQKVRAELRKESAEVKDKLQAAEQAVTAVLGDIQRAESARRHRRAGHRAAPRGGEGVRVRRAARGGVPRRQGEDGRGDPRHRRRPRGAGSGPARGVEADLNAKLTKAELAELARLSPRLDALKEARVAASPRSSPRRLNWASSRRRSRPTSSAGSCRSRPPPTRWTSWACRRSRRAPRRTPPPPPPRRRRQPRHREPPRRWRRRRPTCRNARTRSSACAMSRTTSRAR